MAPELGDTDLVAGLTGGLAADLAADASCSAQPSIHTAPPGWLELDAPDGPHALDAPTVDSDGNGVADTTVLTDPAVAAGVLGLATDLDGDAHVDVLTTVDATGAAHTVTFPAPRAGPPSEWDEGVPPPAPVLDPADGGWTRLPR